MEIIKRALKEIKKQKVWIKFNNQTNKISKPFIKIKALNKE